MKLFLDTNIALDVLMNRAPFAADAARIWSAVERGKAEGLVSAVSFTNIYYITRRAQSRQSAEAAVRVVRDVFILVPCDAAVIDRAIDAGWNDFEDAVQYFSAVAAAADVFVTRDAGRFPAGDPPVMTPAAVLGSHSLK